MDGKIYFKNVPIEYELVIKKVKNVNVTIKPDGKVIVSANKKVPIDVIDKFLVSKGDFILKCFKKFSQMKTKVQTEYFSETEICEVLMRLSQHIYPYFETRGITFPEIKFRKMISKWGSCNYVKGVITFNTNLRFAPPECIDYVVKHEFVHFLQPNHSAEFYKELSVICPEWKECRNKLKNVLLSK